MKSKMIETSVGIFVIIGLLCVAYLTIKLGKMEVLGGDYYFLTAQFNTVAGLKVGAQTEIAGVQVGQVDAITLDTQQMRAIVRLKIRKNIPLDSMVSASIKTSGLIGDRYVSLMPGASDDRLRDGDVIEYTQDPVDLEDMIGRYAFGNLGGHEN